MRRKLFRSFNDDVIPSRTDHARARSNLEALKIRTTESALRLEVPSSQIVSHWHTDLLVGLSYVPDACYLGGYRGSSHPWLREYRVGVGGREGVLPEEVAAELLAYFDTLGQRLEALSMEVPVNSAKDLVHRTFVYELAAWAHGEWIRIHPFANANGRIARLIANYVLAWFRLPPVIELSPRPRMPYMRVAEEAMRGNHAPTLRWLAVIVEDWLMARGLV